LAFVLSIFARLSHPQPVLFTMCAGNELFFVALYLIKWDNTPLYTLLPYSVVTSPVFVENFPPALKHFTAAQLIAALTLPISVGKNIINIVQAWKASKVLVGVDLRDRYLAQSKAT
jgi:CDP-diacylglycerol--inositol 3-phosphatidyltransferase